MKNKTKGLLAAYGMVLPAFLVVMLTVAYPIVSAVIQSFQDEDTGAFTTANYTYFFTETAQRNNLLYTLFVVIVTVVIAIVLAYLLALYLRFVKSRISRAIGMLYLLPRFVPTMCAVYAMITIIRDSGLINRIGLLFGLDIKLGLMYHASGIIVMNMWFNIPFATMMIAAGLGAIPDSIIEASRDSGAGRWKTFTSMILPLSMKDVVVASTFVFMSNVGSFTTPYLMGGNSVPDNIYYGTDIWEKAVTALLCGKNILLVGHKATGKNIFAENLAAAFGRPRWDVSFHVNMDAASLIGMDTFKNQEVVFRP